MGRKASVSPEVLRISIDSGSSSSTESSFRELDDVFLQTQTRIWLGEVLHTRLDEEMAIADLLADGKLLFQVSKVVWKMLLTKCMELRDSKAYICEPATFQKRSRRYMPYSNVDSFLKICQILGLIGIDLFSPSDVVEKRDIRRVCMCIRSVSKKARSKGLTVPDFDVVTYTIAMPTNMVGGIRRSLEQSQHRFLSSAVLGPGMDSKTKFRQTHWCADYVSEHDSNAEESDDAESSYNVFGLDSPASNTLCNDASKFISNTESFPRGTLINVENYISTHCISQSDDLGTNSFMRDSLDDCTSERGYFGCQSDISDSIVHGADTGVSDLYNGEGIYPDTYLQGSNSIDRCSRYGFERRSFEGMEDAEVSSAGSLNSISGKVGILDCEGLFKAEEDNLYIQLPQIQSVDTDYLGDSSMSDFESLEVTEYESFKQDTDKLQCTMKFEDIGAASKSLPVEVCQPQFGKIQNNIVSESVGDNMFHVDSDAIKVTKVQLLSNCSNQLNGKGVLRNIDWDPAEILPGPSDEFSSIQRKYNENHKAINSNGSNGHDASVHPNFVCHSPIEVSRDSQGINDARPLIGYDPMVLDAAPNDPDMNTKENQQISSPSTDCFRNIRENRHEGDLRSTVGYSKHFFAEDSSSCSIQGEYRESIGCESTTSEERTFFTETDIEKVHYIASLNVESPSITEVNRSSFNFTGTFEKSLFRTSSMSVVNSLGFDGNSLLAEIPGRDSMILQANLKLEKNRFPLVEGILESANADGLESSFIGQSERLNLEIEGMASPVDFPSCLEESNVPDHGKQALSLVSLDNLNHDTPYLCVPTPNKGPCKITTSPENVEQNHNNQTPIDGNHLQVVHEACTNLVEDAGNCLENINKDKEKNDKVEGNIGESESNPRKKLLLKSVAGGITLVGVFLLFQLRRKVNITHVPSINVSKANSGEAVKQKKQQGGKGDGVYPGDKLRFKS